MVSTISQTAFADSIAAPAMPSTLAMIPSYPIVIPQVTVVKEKQFRSVSAKSNRKSA